MRRLLLIVLATCAAFSQGLQASEGRFHQAECGRSESGLELYVIRLEAPDRTTKRLTFNNKDDGLLVFKSTSLKHLKWASSLSEFVALTYQRTHRDFGALSARRKNRKADDEFGIVSEDCWDGLRRHIDGLVRTREISGTGRMEKDSPRASAS